MTKDDKAPAASARDISAFARASVVVEARVSGCEYAQNAMLPRIPDRWNTPELRGAWISGYLAELRDRLEVI